MIQRYNLNLVPTGQDVYVRCSQYDKNLRIIEMTLYNGNAVFNIPEGSVVTVRGTKPRDNTGFEYECTYLGSTVSFEIQDQMTVYAGKLPAEIRITKDGAILGSANFCFNVEPAPLTDDTTISETQLPLLEQALQASESARESMLNAQVYAQNASDSATTASESELNALTYSQNARSSANSASQSEANALTYSQNASESASEAQGFAQDASDTAQDVTESVNLAQTYANNAQASARSASQSASEAETAKNLANTAINDISTFNNTTYPNAISGLQSEGATQIANVQAEGATQVGNVQAKGTEVLDSIPADYSTLGNEAQTLKNEMETYVTSRYVTNYPNNRLNLNAIVTGYYLNADGTTTVNSATFYTDYIEVSEGDVVRQIYNNGQTLYRRRICAYDANKNVVASAGSDVPTTSTYTVPSGVKYARLTLDNSTQAKSMITVNLDLRTYEEYTDPTIEIVDDFLSDETKEDVNDVKELLPSLVFDTVAGNNIIPNSDNGTGAYYASGTRIIFAPTYTSFHYAVIPLKPNTDYYLQYTGVIRFLVLAKDGLAVENVETSRLRAFNSGELYDTLYISIANASWNAFEPIVSEGIRGTNVSEQKPPMLSGLTQNNFKSAFACALPKRHVKFTQGINEKFYFDNILALENSSVHFTFANRGQLADDGLSVDTSATGSSTNGYEFIAYDDYLNPVSVLEKTDFSIGTDNLQSCSVLAIGDSTVAFGNMTQHMLDDFANRGKKLTLLGSRGTSPNLNEGRSGWSAENYCTAESVGSVTNAFYNPTTQTFDFSYYMNAMGYSSVDFVVIQLGINDLYNKNVSSVPIETIWGYVKTMIDSILAFNSSQKIIINLPTPLNANLTSLYNKQRKFVKNIFVRYNEYALYRILEYSADNVRESYCHLILDPSVDINDDVHPTDAGFAKMALETLSQINRWQN